VRGQQIHQTPPQAGGQVVTLVQEHHIRFQMAASAHNSLHGHHTHTREASARLPEQSASVHDGKRPGGVL
jgi:hypothetical protein